jgi:kynurenine formamidase
MGLLSEVSLVDLTHTLDNTIPTWTGDCGFKSTILVDYPEVARVLEYQCIASAGTHVDAPSHLVPTGRNIDALTLEELCVEICVVDMTEELHPSAQISIKDFENFEKIYGKIPQGSVVLGNTGWSHYWKTPEKYRGKAEYPVCPSIHPEAGKLFIERGVAGIGIDTLSPDPYGGEYPLHVQLLGADKFILENLTNLDKLPKKGDYLIALPLKIAEGTESPIRAIALVPSEKLKE